MYFRSNIALCTTIYVPLCMYHSFLIRSSDDGHLGCFHVLAIVNSIAINIGVACAFSSFGFLKVYASKSEREKQILYINENIWNLERWY